MTTAALLRIHDHYSRSLELCNRCPSGRRANREQEAAEKAESTNHVFCASLAQPCSNRPAPLMNEFSQTNEHLCVPIIHVREICAAGLSPRRSAHENARQRSLQEFLPCVASINRRMVRTVSHGRLKSRRGKWKQLLKFCPPPQHDLRLDNCGNVHHDKHRSAGRIR